MNSSKVIGWTFGALILLGTLTAEARSHFSFGFGTNISAPSYTYVPVRQTPVYIQQHYAPEQRVIVQDAYGRIISEHVYPGSRQETVYVQPAYERVRVAPRPFFSFGFFR